MTQEPPDSACEIKRLHSVAFEGRGGTVTFARETKRPLEGKGYTPEPEMRELHIGGSMNLYAGMSQPMPVWERYVVRVGADEVHLTETQLRAMLRAVRAAFLKAN